MSPPILRGPSPPASNKAHTAELLPGGDYKLVVKSRAGESLIVEGANLDTATKVDLLDMNGDMFTTADATYADGKLTTEGISFAEPPADGSIRVTTAGGSATYEVMYDNF